MFRVMAVLPLVLLLACGVEEAKGPGNVAAAMFEALQEGDIQEMQSYLSPEMQREMDPEMLENLEVISFSLGEPEYNPDSTEAEIDYTVTLKELVSGDVETEEDDMDLILDSSGAWVIVDI